MNEARRYDLAGKNYADPALHKSEYQQFRQAIKAVYDFDVFERIETMGTVTGSDIISAHISVLEEFIEWFEPMVEYTNEYTEFRLGCLRERAFAVFCYLNNVDVKIVKGTFRHFGYNTWR